MAPNKITEEQWCNEFKAQNIELTDNLESTMTSLNTEPKSERGFFCCPEIRVFC